MSYVRHPKTIDVIIEYLYSEERLPPVSKEDTGEHYTLRALEILSRIIKDFPVRQTNSYTYNTEDVLLARQWMKEHRTNYELLDEPFY